MVESVGKKLNQARVKRGLTIDEAAHATRLRPDKISALENDDYSRFANSIYAKGFLQIYARFLDVDVADFARTLDNANPISVGDYQYLSNAPAQRRDTTQVRREERKPPSLAPLFFFLFIILVAGGYFAYSALHATAMRLEKKQPSTGTASSGDASTPGSVAPEPIAATPIPTVPAPVLAPAPAPVAPPAVAKGPATPVPAVAPIAPPNPRLTFQPAVAPPAPGQTPAPVVAATNPPKTSDQDFVTPTTVPTAESTGHSLPGGVNEVQVATVKKTWVTVRKDDPKAPPIFEDYVYPRTNPLKLKGARFFIELRGDSADVQITKNGLPYAYQAANVPVE